MSVRCCGLLCAASLILTCTAAQAAGFYIQEQSVSGLGAAFSGSATNLHDPSTIFFNPAGMTKLEGGQLQTAAHILMPNARLTDTGTTIDANGPGVGGIIPIGNHPVFTTSGNGGNPYGPSPVPNGFFSQELGGGLWAGLGVTAPFGLASDYDANWFGRYDSTKTELQVLDFQPTLAYRVNDSLSLGGGVNIQRSHAVLESTVTNFVTEGTSRLEGEDWKIGYTLGVQAAPYDGTVLGASYHSAITHQLDGAITVTGVAGLNGYNEATAKLKLPDQAIFGIAQKIGDHWTVQGQATWFGWSNFDAITAIYTASDAIASEIVQNYQTSWAFAFGAEYAMNADWTFRGGLQLDRSPTTDEYRTSRTPDGDRTWVSLGATHVLTPALDLDLAGTYIDIKDEEIGVLRNGGFVNVQADTGGHVGIFAVSLTHKF